MQRWFESHRFDARALPLANRRYNRQNVDSPQFVPPGSPIVLLTAKADALWVSLRQIAEFQDHAWPGAWMNTLFRNESTEIASTLIREAIAVTLGKWGEPPAAGMVTFVDTTKVREKSQPGNVYRIAGFKPVGFTKSRKLLVLQLLPADMPPPIFLPGSQLEFSDSTPTCAPALTPPQRPDGVAGS